MLYQKLLRCLWGQDWLTAGEVRGLLRAFNSMVLAFAVDADVPKPTVKVRRSMKLSVLWAVAAVVVMHRHLVVSAIVVLLFVVALHSYLFAVSLVEVFAQ